MTQKIDEAVVEEKMGATFVPGQLILNGDRENVATQVVELISRELGTMLAQNKQNILMQLGSRYTIVAFSIDQPEVVVGFVTLWPLTSGSWFELGSLVVRNQTEPSFRGRGIATKLVELVLAQAGDEINILATAKLAQAINALTSGGMPVMDFERLPGYVHAATCICTGAGEGGKNCPKRNGACRLVVAAPTLLRLKKN